ncbi:TetR/AcrR family transcriptional regulator [Caulobacter sp. BP25]|uniref:TetR/AcrR family transcriptional regulator n=1 Tax=Caulobacter sp. BP25 TaxID=2048900 RepID=UPI000C12B8AC|nr:TetR/AcrR family transcriptional regulator [Caulobacter sp. BP25]PHY17586.1 TetR family transcriptional regulator [Caulobacter sp. BP25]
MRYAPEHKQETRARVLKEAAKAIRAQGVQKVGVAEVMSRAGLTHGGFYAHFGSRDDLIAQAIDQMFLEGADQIKALSEGRSPAEGLVSYIGFYLSRAHCDARGAGCPIPFLSADAPRLNETARARTALGMRQLIDALAALFARMEHPAPLEAASSLLSELVGAVCMARIELDFERSELILMRARRGVLARFGLATSS